GFANDSIVFSLEACLNSVTIYLSWKFNQKLYEQSCFIAHKLVDRAVIRKIQFVRNVTMLEEPVTPPVDIYPLSSLSKDSDSSVGNRNKNNNYNNHGNANSPVGQQNEIIKGSRTLPIALDHEYTKVTSGDDLNNSTGSFLSTFFFFFFFFFGVTSIKMFVTRTNNIYVYVHIYVYIYTHFYNFMYIIIKLETNAGNGKEKEKRWDKLRRFSTDLTNVFQRLQNDNNYIRNGPNDVRLAAKSVPGIDNSNAKSFNKRTDLQSQITMSIATTVGTVELHSRALELEDKVSEHLAHKMSRAQSAAQLLHCEISFETMDKILESLKKGLLIHSDAMNSHTYRESIKPTTVHCPLQELIHRYC
ncbi:hypothetical protein RFI_16154, partial [Reticulomyxa filosa]